MMGANPYSHYDKPLIDFKPTRPVYDHQLDLIRHALTYHYCIWASEMGTGKTLSAIEVMEASGITKWFYVAPKSALAAVRLEFEKWESKIKPAFFTYEQLRSALENWPGGQKPPGGIILDEVSRCKNPAAKRTQAAQHIANAIRDEFGWDGFMISMSGAPAPKSPLDWWSLCEIAMPGFLREGNQEKFRERLAIMSQGQSDSGQIFQKLVTWRDDSKKCNTCGKASDAFEHDLINPSCHAFGASENEVTKLYKRMIGVVNVKRKADCLDLPEKQYRIIRCTPTLELINAAKLLAARNESTIKTLTLLRELSDGFQYQMEDIGKETCPCCDGKRTLLDWVYVGSDEEYESVQEKQFNGQPIPDGVFEKREKACAYCDGTGESIRYQREAIQVPTAKEDALDDIIDQHNDIGRLVCYAGFTGSVDRCVQIFIKNQWSTIRVDGRGWQSDLGSDPMDLLRIFMYKQETHPRVAFIAQPGAGGMGLNLTASPSIVYFSNDFNGESRSQSEDRIHRLGMDKNRGATIYDIINLPTDEKVLKNLKEKKRLESLTLGEFRESLNTYSEVSRL